MNTSSTPAVARRGLHPLVATAAVCIIALCVVAVAAIMGWLPAPNARQEQSVATLDGPENANLAPLPANQPGAAPAPPPSPAPASRQAQSQPASAAAGQQQAAPLAPPQAPAAAAGQAVDPAANCPSCGVVSSMGQVQVPVQDRSNHIVGTVAGGVVGGVVGNQFGGGGGRTALTVLGAVGGALAGHEIERNIKQQQTVTRYQLVARTNDGRTHTFRSDTPFQYSPGQPIRVENNQLLPR
jgi:outer membrane lipoprotein SlyB